MNIGILTPGFSAHEDDWAIPSMQNYVTALAQTENVRLIALRYPPTQQPYELGGAAVYPLGFGSAASGWQRLRLWLAALRLIRRLHHERPFDVLHATWSDETGLLATWAGRWLGIPSVTTITGGELVCFPDIAYGSQCSRFGRWIVGQALKAEAVVVSGSHSQGLIAQAGYEFVEEKIHRIVWGVDTGLFTPPIQPRLVKHLLHVASLVPIKNQHLLLRTVARLDDDIQLDIVGEGPLRRELEAFTSELGIQDRVHFLGAVSYPQMPAYYQRASLYVMTSRNEGVPMTVLEAGACGLPSVSTAVGIPPDHPSLGISVPADEVALADAIRTLLADENRLSALQRSAFETVRDQFSVQRTAKQYRTLFAELKRR